MIQQGAFETVVLFSRPKRLLQKVTEKHKAQVSVELSEMQ